MSYRHEKKKYSTQLESVKMVFSCQKYSLKSLKMCLKWSSMYIIILIALSHLFNALFVYARTAVPRTHKFVRDLNLVMLTHINHWTHVITLKYYQVRSIRAHSNISCVPLVVDTLSLCRHTTIYQCLCCIWTNYPSRPAIFFPGVNLVLEIPKQRAMQGFLQWPAAWMCAKDLLSVCFFFK